VEGEEVSRGGRKGGREGEREEKRKFTKTELATKVFNLSVPSCK